MEGSTTAARVSELLMELVSRFLPNRSKEDIDTVHNYCTFILSSTIAPSSVGDPFALTEGIKKDLVRDGKNEEALKVQQLYQKLETYRIPKHKWAVLYLLYNLSNSGGSPGLRDVHSVLDEKSEYFQFSPGGLPVIYPKTGSKRAATTERLPLQTTTPFTQPPTSRRVWSTADTPTINAAPTLPPQTTDTAQEDMLIADCVHCLGGVDGQFMKYDPESKHLLVQDSNNFPITLSQLAESVVEPGGIVRRIQDSLSNREEWEQRGLICQGLWSAVQTELRDYYKSVAELEGQYNASPDSLSLRRLWVWSQNPKHKLRLLEHLTLLAKTTSGGALLSAIRLQANHGDPMVQEVVEYVLTMSSAPLFDMVRRWAREGELDDAFREFFVACDDSIPDSQLWSKKYKLRVNMKPSFISDDVAHRIMLVGKSINFLRRCCGDSSFYVDQSVWPDESDGIVFGAPAILDTRIRGTEAVVNERLMSVIMTNYSIDLHLSALKKYILLGQGDFIQRLMDLMHTELDKPASDLFRHNLSGFLEQALRQSNAQFEDPDVLSKLDVRILQAVPGDCGWDVFTLDYRVDRGQTKSDTNIGPLNTILSPAVMEAYLRIFSFLWRLRRTEHVLNTLWSKDMNLAKIAHSAELNKTHPGLSSVLQKCHVVRAEMIHVVRQLQYYAMFEVLECSWEKLQKALKSATNFDALMTGHTKFLFEVLQKAMLTKESEGVMKLVTKLLDVCLRFRNSQISLGTALEAEIARLRNVAARAYERTKAGDWGVTADDADAELAQAPRGLVPGAQANLDRIAIEFSETLKATRTALSLGSKSTTTRTEHKELQYLGLRLDFNKFYSTKA